MKKHDDNLFQIGEGAKILGVTRKALLIYEDMGLLTPAVKDKDSGITFDDIKNQLNGKLESYKLPVHYEWIEEIPKTQNGKIQRGLLK